MKTLLRVGSVCLALVFLFGVAIIVGVLADTERDTILWRFALIALLTLAVGYAAGELWRRSNRLDRGAPPPA